MDLSKFLLYLCRYLAIQYYSNTEIEMIIYMCDINDHVYVHVSSSVLDIVSQIPIYPNNKYLTQTKNPDLLHLFIWGTSIRGLQYPRRSRWALIFMLWEVSEKTFSCCEPWNQSETYAKCCRLLETINESC